MARPIIGYDANGNPIYGPEGMNTYDAARLTSARQMGLGNYGGFTPYQAGFYPGYGPGNMPIGDIGAWQGNMFQPRNPILDRLNPYDPGRQTWVATPQMLNYSAIPQAFQLVASPIAPQTLGAAGTGAPNAAASKGFTPAAGYTYDPTTGKVIPTASSSIVVTGAGVNQGQTQNQNNGGLGVGGGVGQATGKGIGGNVGAGDSQPNAPSNAQADVWFDQNGLKHHKDFNINYGYQVLDRRLGVGFTDQFIQRMGSDPISWYAKQYANSPRFAGWDLPDARGADAREKLIGFAAYAAESDAKFLPGAVEEWKKVHGNAEIPREQWERWSRIALATGGDPLNVGVGENPYGVY